MNKIINQAPKKQKRGQKHKKMHKKCREGNKTAGQGIEIV